MTIRFKLALRVAALAVVAILPAGCVTYGEVKEIVEESNRSTVLASLAAQGTSLVPRETGANASNWQTSVQRIEEFIANNPDQERTNNALRIREAVILLNAGQSNLARAVFAEVECEPLGSSRDRAICNVQDHLVWFYGLGRSMSGQDKERASAAMTGLADSADVLTQGSSIRHAFEQMRVRIAVRLARTHKDKEDVRAKLGEALERYGNQFTDAERSIIQQWHSTNSLSADQGRELMRSLRWYDYVPTVYESADSLNDQVCGRDPADCPDFSPAWITCIRSSSCE